MNSPVLLQNKPSLPSVPRFNPRAGASAPQTHGSGGSRRHRSATDFQRVNLQHLYTVGVSAEYLRHWQRRRHYWRLALEYPYGACHGRALPEHQHQRHQSPLAAGRGSYLASLHHRGRFWWNLSSLLRAEWEAARFLREQLLQQLCWNWLELAKRHRRRQLHRGRPAQARRGVTHERWHVRKRRLFRPQRRAGVRLKQWALEQRVPLDHAVVASELDWIYRTKIRKSFHQMRRRRSVAFFAGPYRSHRRLLRLSRGRNPSGPALRHLSAARVRRLAQKLRQNRVASRSSAPEALDPLLRGSFRDPSRHSYRGCHFRALPTPFHLFGTASFSAKRDFRWLAQKILERDPRLKESADVWRLVNPEKALRRQMQLLRWQRSRQNRRHFLRYFSKKTQRLARLEAEDRRCREEDRERDLAWARSSPGLTFPSEADRPRPVYPPDYFTPEAAQQRQVQAFRQRARDLAQAARTRARRFRNRSSLVQPSLLPSVRRRPSFMRYPGFLNPLGLPLQVDGDDWAHRKSAYSYPPPTPRGFYKRPFLWSLSEARLRAFRKPGSWKIWANRLKYVKYLTLDRRVSLPPKYIQWNWPLRFPVKGLFTHRTLQKTPSWHAREPKNLRFPAKFRNVPATLRPEPQPEYFSETQTFGQQNALRAAQHRERLFRYLERFPPLDELPSLSRDYRLWGSLEGVGPEPLDPRFRVRRRGYALHLCANFPRQLRWFGRWTPRERCVVRRTLAFRRRQFMARPADGLWNLAKLHEVNRYRRERRWVARYWVDPALWLGGERATPEAVLGEGRNFFKSSRRRSAKNSLRKNPSGSAGLRIFFFHATAAPETY